MSSNQSAYSAVALALHGFWNSFGMPAFVKNSVPKGMKRPYITYTFSIAGFMEKSKETAVFHALTTDNTAAREVFSMLLAAVPDEGVIIRLNNSLGSIRLSKNGESGDVVRNADNLALSLELKYSISYYMN
jgi:hypothetical protein